MIMGHPTENRALALQEYSSVCSFPMDYQFLNYKSGVSIMGNSVPPMMMYHIAKTIQIEILDKLP